MASVVKEAMPTLSVSRIKNAANMSKNASNRQILFHIVKKMIGFCYGLT